MTERHPPGRTGEPTPAQDASRDTGPPHADDQPVPRFDALGQEVPRFDALGVPDTGRQEPSRPEPPPMPPRTAPASPRPLDMPYGPHQDIPYHQNGHGIPDQNGHGNGVPSAGSAPPAAPEPPVPPPRPPAPAPPAADPTPTPPPTPPAPYERPDPGWPPATPDILTGQPAYLLYDQETAAYATPLLQPQPDIGHPMPQYTGPAHQAAGDVLLPWERPAAPHPAEAWYPPDEVYATPLAPAPAPSPVREPAKERTAVRRSRRLPAPMRPAREHTVSLLSHLGGVLTGFLLPTVLYALFRSRSSFTRLHSAEAFNFQLTLMLGYVGAAILGVLFTGFLVLIPVWVVSLVFGIQAAVAADTGHEYRYPFIVRFID